MKPLGSLSPVVRPAAWRGPIAAAIMAAAAAAGCGGGSDSSDSGNTVNGSARIGWDQQAADVTELATLRFAMYIDGVRTLLPGADCSRTAGAVGFPCTSALPAMSVGRHSLELASYIETGSLLESARSAPLVITVTGAAANTSAAIVIDIPARPTVVAAPPTSPRLVTTDGTSLDVAIVFTIDRPSALAVGADGLLVIGDDAGAVHVLRGGDAGGPMSVTSTEARDAAGGAILDLALDPEFSRNHFVYVLDTSGGETPQFRLARFREVSGRLGERAVLLDSVPAAATQPAAALSFGSDGKLYVALDDGGDAQTAAQQGSYSGKVLRLNADGTTPRDQRAATPIYARNVTSPRGMAWDDETASLWLTDAGQGSAQLLRGAGGRAATRAAYALPIDGGPGSVSLYRGTLIPAFGGSLLVAPAMAGDYLLRAGLRPDGTAVASTERLTLAGVSRVRGVKVGPDGAVYVVTDRDVRRIGPD